MHIPALIRINATFLEYENVDTQEVVLSNLIKLQTEIKWDTNPLHRVEAWCITGE